MSISLRLKPFLVCLAIPICSGIFSSLLSGDMQAAYQALNLPVIAPPAWVFGAVWPVLHLLMGIASYMVWQGQQSALRTQALTFYAVCIVMGVLWSPIFFRFGAFRPAFYLACGMIVMAAVTIANFYRLSHKSGLLLIPYLLWLIYASVLCYLVAAMNV